MRTTIELPDELFRRLKAVSSLRGLTLRKFVLRAIERELAGSAIKLEPREIRFPIVRSKRPGAAKITPDRIAALLEAEDMHVSP